MSTQEIIQEIETLELKNLKLEDLQEIQKLVQKKIQEVIISKHKEEDENLPIMYLNEEDSKSVEEAIKNIKLAHKNGTMKSYTANELITHLQNL